MRILLALFFPASLLLATPAPSSGGSFSPPKGVITPPTTPLVENGLGITTTGDFTWWKALNSGFEPGWKVCFDMDLAHDGWDALGEYTYFHEPKNQGQRQLFHILDLNIGRGFFLSRQISLRPHFGFKLSRMFYDLAQESQSLKGIGTRIGIDSLWHLVYGLSFYGNFAFTALWSDYHVQSQSTQTILPVFETSLGLAYEFYFFQNSYKLLTKAGWEEQIWSDYNRLNDSNTALTIQGLTVSIGFSF